MKLTREKIKRIAGQGGIIIGSGGAGEGSGEVIAYLKKLKDVNLTNEADGEVLVFNGTSGEWENKEKAPKAEEADHAAEADEVPWTGVQDVITGSPNSNEFNMCDTTPSGNKIWFNYKGRQGSNLLSQITEYDFGNGQGARTNVTVRAENFYADGYVTALSDIREKDTVGAVELDLDKIAEAPAIRFVWKNREDGRVHAGTAAQYWEEVLPEVVRKQSDGLLTMDYAVAALVSAITLARELRTLKDKLAEQGIKV